MNKPKRINWTNTIFLVLTPIIAIAGTVTLIVMGQVSWNTVILALSLVIATGLAVTAGYHRLFSHASYKAAWPVRLIFLLLATAAFEGSVLEWCTDHRDHHRYTDTEKDPYNIKQGFWYAHIGWLFTLDISKRDMSNVDDLNKDPLVRFQHRFFVPLAIFMGFILPTLIASLWGDALGGLIIAGFLRVVITQHTTFCINSVCHVFGKQFYSTRTSARDHWFTAFFTMGEGYHNFHHQFPIDYRNGIRFHQFDPTKWLIRTLSFFGLTKDLKRVGSHRITHYRIDMEHNSLTELTKNTHKSLQQLYHSIMQTLSHIDESEKARKTLKASKVQYILDRMTEYRKTMKGYCQQINKSKSDLKYLLKSWKHMVNDLT